MSVPSNPTIELTVAHNKLAFIYRRFTPTVEINGVKERRPWGVHRAALSPGAYDVSVSYPWLLNPECGRNTVRVILEAGEERKIKYCARLLRYLPGKITVT